jgi:aminoglycoside phosphotransferase family enzyme
MPEKIPIQKAKTKNMDISSQKLCFKRVCEFLSDPATHHQNEKVDVITTHGANVFLTRDIVYKIKQPVKYDYLDFSNLQNARTFAKGN